MKKLVQPLKWHGGKSYLAKRIVSLFPPHLHFVEPYAGGLSVLLARDPDRDWFIDDAWRLKHGDKVPAGLRGCSEVVNDISGELTNFWRVLQCPVMSESLQRRLECTPFSEPEYETATGIAAHNRIEAARAFFTRCRQSLAGRMDWFAPLSRTRTRGGMNEQASAWLNAIEGLPAVHARLKRVVILNDDALNVIRKQDGDKTLFYCDPPYLHETRMATDVYEHEMTDDQHVALLECLATIKGKFLLSGYRNGFYDEWTDAYSWHRRDFEIANNASGKKKKPTMTECVWTNYEPPEDVS